MLCFEVTISMSMPASSRRPSRRAVSNGMGLVTCDWAMFMGVPFDVRSDANVRRPEVPVLPLGVIFAENGRRRNAHLANQTGPRAPMADSRSWRRQPASKLCADPRVGGERHSGNEGTGIREVQEGKAGSTFQMPREHTFY